MKAKAAELKNRISGWKWTAAATTLLAATGGSLTGCGQQSFIPVSNTSEAVAPGNFVIPPKVDILFAEDDTGSMNEILPQVSKQMPKFLEGLQAKNWDYHFALVPLTKDRAIQQITASHHDGNWGSSWVAPYPGAVAGGAGTIVANLFRLPTEKDFTPYMTTTDLNTGLNGFETGLENIRLALKNRIQGTGFLRDDALLVIVALSNGEDTSGVTYCQRGDGYTQPCEELSQTGGTYESSLDYYKSQFLSVKADAAQLKFFAAVAGSSTCMGAPNSKPGIRYQRMASALNGEKFDICTNSISSILESLTSKLQSVKVALRTRYLFIDADADVSSIEVMKYVGGNAATAVKIEQDAENGWTYAGYLSNVHAIDSPVPMNISSGYAIELHGSAKLTGDDTAKVTFRGAGTQTSSK